MWLTVYPIALALFWLWSCFGTFDYALHVVVLGSALYLLHYLTYVYHVSHPRAWPAFRSLSLWNYMHRGLLGGTLWAESNQWHEYSEPASRVFIVKEGSPHIALAVLLTFGLHGKTPAALNRAAPIIVLPDSLFRLPLIANLCQWAGGVPYDPAKLTPLLKCTSIVIMLPESDEKTLNYLRWVMEACDEDTVLVPVFYRGTEHFYANMGPVHFGFCGTCIPRACHIRIGVYRPRIACLEQTCDADTLLLQMQHDFGILEAIIQ
jgi:hypothetical protein